MRRPEKSGVSTSTTKCLKIIHPVRSEVPWHRVVNVKGGISPRGDGDSHNEQYDRLALEGVAFDALGRIDLSRFEWDYGG